MKKKEEEFQKEYPERGEELGGRYSSLKINRSYKRVCNISSSSPLSGYSF